MFKVKTYYGRCETYKCLCGYEIMLPESYVEYRYIISNKQAIKVEVLSKSIEQILVKTESKRLLIVDASALHKTSADAYSAYVDQLHDKIHAIGLEIRRVNKVKKGVIR